MQGLYELYLVSCDASFLCIFGNDVGNHPKSVLLLESRSNTDRGDQITDP